MTGALDQAGDALAAARELHSAIKAGTNVITIADARQLLSTIHEAEVWLQSCRDLLELDQRRPMR